MVDFAGWALPIFHSGILEEHHVVRQAAGLFDVSHMGRLRIEGPHAFALLQLALTNDLSALQPGRGRYTLLCLENGGTLDDAIAFRLADEAFQLIPNAVNKDAVLAHLLGLRARNDFRVEIIDQTDSTAMLALQGPSSARILADLSPEPIDELRFFAHMDAMIGGIACCVSRSGYTGEDGFEISCAAGQGEALWTAILEAGQPHGLLPAGLGARDSLRIEAGLPLYGHELSREINAAYSGLDFAIKLEKSDFIGKQAVAAASRDGRERVLSGFCLSVRAVPREGFAIARNGAEIGRVTSGVFSPTLGRGIGMAYIEARHAVIGAPIEVAIRQKAAPAVIVERPFVPRGRRA